MFIFQQVEVLIGVRLGYVVDIIVKSTIPKPEPEQVQQMFQSTVMEKLLELNEISQKFEARHFSVDPVRVPIKDGDISASTTVIFKNADKMEGFLQEVNNSNQA